MKETVRTGDPAGTHFEPSDVRLCGQTDEGERGSSCTGGGRASARLDEEGKGAQLPEMCVAGAQALAVSSPKAAGVGEVSGVGRSVAAAWQFRAGIRQDGLGGMDVG